VQREEMTAHDHLQVHVNDELVLDAGTCVQVSGPNGPELLIRPPEATLFHQVLAYLRAKNNPPVRLSGSMAGREGVAAAAVVLRWGSYLALLLDRDKPLWAEVDSAGTSRISDAEMARINIESSSGLEEWLVLCRADPRGYMQFVDRAVFYLPMPKKSAKLKVTEFGSLADPGMAARLIQATDTTRVARVRGEAERHPTRVFANALVNTAWRNGPVEDIHAGSFRGCPIDQRRMRPNEERKLMGFASERLALGMAVCQELTMERPRRTWSEQVLAYGLAEWWLVTPRGWSLDETSREVRLPTS
jgi:hypothetical protein